MQHSLFGGLAASISSVAQDGKPLEALPLGEAAFTVIDLETTGLSSKKNAITEVVAITFRDGEEVGKYSTLVKPTEVIPEEVEMLTGITNDMVRQAPPLITVLSELAGFLGESPVIVGHNVGFDIGFLREKVTQSGLEAFLDRFDAARSFCTRLLALKALPGLPSYEGIMVATAVGYHNPNPHRAEADVRMSAAILFALIRKIREENPRIRTVRELLNWQGPL
jgi:DNA polymerase III epsilon subunit family exonuclease